MSDTHTSSGGVGVTGLLLVLFIGLKLGGVIDWSWWWVLSPAWGSVAVVLLALAGYFVVRLSMEVLKDRRRRKRAARITKGSTS